MAAGSNLSRIFKFLAVVAVLGGVEFERIASMQGAAANFTIAQSLSWWPISAAAVPTS